MHYFLILLKYCTIITLPPQKAVTFLDNHIIKYNTLTTRCRRLVWRPGPDQKKQNMWDAAWSSRDRWIYWISRFTYPNQVRLWLVLHEDYLYKRWLSWRDKWLRSDASRRRMVAWETIILALKASFSVDVQWCAITRDVSESSRIGNEGIIDSFWINGVCQITVLILNKLFWSSVKFPVYRLRVQFGCEPLVNNPFEKRGGSSPLLRLECVYVNSVLNNLCTTKVGYMFCI